MNKKTESLSNMEITTNKEIWTSEKQFLSNAVEYDSLKLPH